MKGLGEMKHEAAEPHSTHPQQLSLVCSADLLCSCRQAQTDLSGRLVSAAPWLKKLLAIIKTPEHCVMFAFRMGQESTEQLSHLACLHQLRDLGG